MAPGPGFGAWPAVGAEEAGAQERGWTPRGAGVAAAGLAWEGGCQGQQGKGQVVLVTQPGWVC